MKIALTSTSLYNLYASTILFQLLALGYRDFKVILISQRNKRLYYRIKSRFAAIVRNFLKLQPAMNISPYLVEYSISNNLGNPATTLDVICRNKKAHLQYFRALNDDETVKYLRTQEIDLLINAGGGIFGKSIVASVKIGILNAHMGFLPTYRGMNALEWSAFYGERIGVTLHFIDAGIDTGDILQFKEIPVSKGDAIENLRAKSQIISIELILNFIENVKNDQWQRIKQRPEEGKQYFVMHPRLKKIAQKNLACYESTVCQGGRTHKAAFCK